MHGSILSDVFALPSSIASSSTTNHVTQATPLTTLVNMVSCTMQNKRYAEQSLFMLHERFIFVVITGSGVSILGILANAILLRIFSQKRFRGTNFTYLMVLAVFDITILINYILLIGLGLSKDYFRSLWLHHFWYFYFRPLFTLGRIVQVAQTCLILATTVERYISVYRRSALGSLTTTKRVIVITIVILFAIASKITSYWELDVVYTNCSGFASIMEQRGLLINNQAYNDYKLYVDPVLQTYIPFSLLLLLNILVTVKVRVDWKRYVSLIVNNMISKYYPPEAGPPEAQQEMRAAQRDLRDATLTTAGIVTCYLISNSLNVVLTFLEQAKASFLEKNPRFHMLSADFSSFLVILTSSIRLPLYYFCNSKIRTRVDQIFSPLRCRKRRLSRSKVLHITPQRFTDLTLYSHNATKYCGYSASIYRNRNGTTTEKSIGNASTFDTIENAFQSTTLNGSLDGDVSVSESYTQLTDEYKSLKQSETLFLSSTV